MKVEMAMVIFSHIMTPVKNTIANTRINENYPLET
jgi:hypothetical protein